MERSIEHQAIIQAALDYIEGWHEGDAQRMERSLHPDLAKRIVMRKTSPYGGDQLSQISALGLVQKTRRGIGLKPREERRTSVTVLDQSRHSASVKIETPDTVEYLHLSTWNEVWVVVNVLWELKEG
ncbi:hypothetical protein KDA_30350 [Dictyobacter alpinus]|uniref:Nuclear transport factor 2 family protein n=1 Tax=Dictyobacter alpinus TaxID=2014873 RepID=A0A402B848_9CHLR|nr:nuclear transport factor 2 family protein [Dictyobacter alpinus]GCE27551.1 hypothetical protein KDA_30350 [Dictyobacter alpinus]